MKKNGISMIVFVIAIAMILVLVTAVTASYTNIIKSTRLKEFANEIRAVQNAANEYKFMNGEYPITEVCAIQLDSTAVKEADQNNYSYYVLDVNKLGLSELKHGMPGNVDTLDVYAISKNTDTVYYLAGVEIDKKWYYYLTDDLKQKLDI